MRSRRKKKDETVLGIDLGATSIQACIWKDNRIKPVLNETGSSNLPSYIGFTKHEMHIGNSAQDQIPDNPLNTIYHIKRILGL